jgi:hypothetical protein
MKKIKTIFEFVEQISHKTKTEKEILNNLFDITQSNSNIVFDQSYIGEREKQYINQKIVRISNKYSYEEAIYNNCRKRSETQINPAIMKLIKNTKNDFLCDVKHHTPKDIFGRISTSSSSTASVLKKYDAWHSLVVFKEHNPYKINITQIKDLLKTAIKWKNMCDKKEKRTHHLFIIWNCLWKSEKSLVHSHAHIFSAQDKPYPKIRFINEYSNKYYKEHNSKYFEDLIHAHKIAGLILKSNNQINSFVNITPTKEAEITLISKKINNHLIKEIYWIINAYIHKLKSERFSLMICTIPNDKNILIKICDRGNFNYNNDISGMELYSGTSIITSDPFQIKEILLKKR